MNAIALEILINRYYDPSPYKWDGNEKCVPALSPAQHDAFNYLYCSGLLTPAPGDEDSVIGETAVSKKMRRSVITEKGQVHVKALLIAPLPEHVWRSPFLAEGNKDV